MGLLQEQYYELPDFNLSEQYRTDLWDVLNFEIYKDATESQIKRWKRRSAKYNYRFNFALCENKSIREELKYCISLSIESGISIATLGEKFDYFKHLAKFFNDNFYNSMLEVSEEEVTKYCIDVLHIKGKVNNGKYIVGTKGEYTNHIQKNATIMFFNSCIKKLNNFYDSKENKNIMQRDIWKASFFQTVDETQDCDRTIDFSDIENNEFKTLLKQFCLNRMNSISYKSVANYKNKIALFFKWLNDFHKDIIHLNQINREIIEEYFIWIRTESPNSKQVQNQTILSLKVFFEIGNLLEFENFPKYNLILNTDYVLKSKTKANPLTEAELQEVIKLIPKLPKLQGKVLYCLITLGCRVSEVLHLKPEALKQYPDGNYYLLLYQYKTKTEYEKPIPLSTAKIIDSEIKRNTKRFDNVKYVFLTNKGKPLSLCVLSRSLRDAIVKYDVRDRDGNLLHCNTHRFRSTLATSLMNSGYDVETTGKLLGHKSLQSLAYYANVSNETVKEQLKPRIEKDQLLITSIGKFDEKILSDYEAPIALCNGFCVKPNTLGICAKANHCLECNMFVPTSSYLNHYERQLQEVNANIEVARANNYEPLLQKNLKTKESLEKIISRIKERRNTNE